VLPAMQGLELSGCKRFHVVGAMVAAPKLIQVMGPEGFRKPRSAFISRSGRGLAQFPGVVGIGPAGIDTWAG